MSTIGNKEYSVEFNDSVFESQAWKKSRYEGQGLNGAQINRYTTGDITYGKTPVVRNVSRNIYIGNAVMPLGDAAASGDETLVQFPSSSYITIQKYITINSDDSISENNYDGSNLDSKNGFYRAFYEDFPIGGDFQLRLLDENVDNFTLDNYKVVFNQGKLHQNVYWTSDGSNTDVEGYGNAFIWGDASAASSDFYNGTFNIRNNQYTNFYTGSRTAQFIKFRYQGPQNFFTALTDHLSKSPQNRAFATFENTDSGSIVLDSQYQNNYIGSYPFGPGPLARFATAEIKQSAFGTAYYTSHKSLFGGATTILFGTPVFPQLYDGNDYGYYISSLNDSTPSILTNLFKPEQLPGDVGNLPFIVIPSNLHPYIKDNLLYFLGQAGIDIGNRRIPSQLDGQNQKLT
jgi:hypothetical protein